MAGNLVVPEWNPTVDWVTQYEIFMDTFKLWKADNWDGKAVSGKEAFQRMIQLMSCAQVTRMDQEGCDVQGIVIAPSKYNRAQRYAWSCLILEIKKKKEKAETQLLWLSDHGRYPFKTHVVLNLPKDASLMSAVECAQDFLTSCKWIKYAEYCIEYHTESGGHPHCDMAIMTDNKRYSSVANVKSALFDAKNERIKISALKKYLKDWHSISVTKWNENTLDYVNGDKQSGKMEFVELDKLMRSAAGIEDKYVYKA